MVSVSVRKDFGSSVSVSVRKDLSAHIGIRIGIGMIISAEPYWFRYLYWPGCKGTSIMGESQYVVVGSMIFIVRSKASCNMIPLVTG